MKAEGLSNVQIAAQLDELSVATKGGTPPNHQAVSFALINAAKKENLTTAEFVAKYTVEGAPSPTGVPAAAAATPDPTPTPEPPTPEPEPTPTPEPAPTPEKVGGGVDWQKVRQSASSYLPIRDSFYSTRDVEAFRDAMKSWSGKSATYFNGFAGQMYLNQIANYTTDMGALADLLTDVLRVPSDEAEASRKIDRLVDYVGTIKKGSAPAAGYSPFFLSCQWGLVDQSKWPVFWPSASRFVEFVTGQDLPETPSERYGTFLDLVRDLDSDYERFETVAAWWDKEKPVLMDPVLADRCEFGRRWDADMADQLRINAKALVKVAGYWAEALKEAMEESFDLDYVYLPPLEWVKDRPRGDTCVIFRSIRETLGPGIQVGMNEKGLFIGADSGLGRAGWTRKAAQIMGSWTVEGCEVISTHRSALETRHQFGWRPDQVMYGRFWGSDALPPDLRKVALVTASELSVQVRDLLDQFTEFSHHPPKTNEPPRREPESEPKKPAELAEKLLLQPSFMEEIINLLEDKRQVIFYGPPGTGKTFLAKELAECLAPDDSQRAFVQFHPSMSYEDFFEGYRPHTGDDGAMSYRLTSGPLRHIARRAEANRDDRYIMIIDEINRANLPKVLGELLFLLEYRDDTVLPLYRPSEPFGLPPNLWFIGTMNTADRSIALVDAALRRRFHFVPFFPHSGPMEGLLERWLAANNEQRWVGELVAEVNGRLSEALGGPHLQLGHSHFMKQGISDLETGQMKMVWRYTVEPFIEEQFFDDPDQVRSFRWEEVIKPYISKRDIEDPAAVESQTDEDQTSPTD